MNTGYKGFGSLEQYYIDDNTPTGTTKANTEGGADYIAPALDNTTCTNGLMYSAEITVTATRNNCGTNATGTPVTITYPYGWRTAPYSANPDVRDSFYNMNPVYASMTAQTNANTYGFCILDPLSWSFSPAKMGAENLGITVNSIIIVNSGGGSGYMPLKYGDIVSITVSAPIGSLAGLNVTGSQTYSDAGTTRISSFQFTYTTGNIDIQGFTLTGGV